MATKNNKLNNPDHNLLQKVDQSLIFLQGCTTINSINFQFMTFFFSFFHVFILVQLPKIKP